MNNLTLGVLGGMGTYATIHLFQQYTQVFPAEKEWDRPRIIIDNRCTMPSRVKAFLYHEDEDLLITQMSESLNMLASSGCNKIILACNTSHLFLPKIYEKYPSLKHKIVNIIDQCVNKIAEDKIISVYLLASEGTIESNIYQIALKEKGINVSYPSSEDYNILRECIEAVKQNKYNNQVKQSFLKLLEGKEYCILGCTELPILYEKYFDSIKTTIYDPLLITLNNIKKEIV